MPIETKKQQRCEHGYPRYENCIRCSTAPATVPAERAERVEEHSLPWSVEREDVAPAVAWIRNANEKIVAVTMATRDAELTCAAVNAYSANQAEREVAGQLAKALQMHMQWIGPAPTDAHSYDSLREDAWKLGIKALAAFNQLRRGGE